MEYKGFAFSKSFERGRKSGTISVREDHLVFCETASELWMAIDENLEVKSSGSGGRVIYFNRESNPELSFCTSEKAILKEECLAELASVKHLNRKRNKARTVMTSIVGVTLGIIVLIGYMLFASVSPAVKYAANSVPFEWEKKIGDKLSTLILADMKILDDKELLDQLNIITEPLVESIKQTNPEYDFKFNIANNPQVNAFAIPGGVVVVNSGLIAKSDSPEEIAGVLAHELAHVTCRHHIRSIIKNVGFSMIIGMIIGDYAKLEKYSATLMTLKNSRAFEYEADEVGLGYIRRCGVDPDGMVTFFEKLSDNETDEKALYESMNLFSTHPPTDKRIERLNELIASKNSNKEIYNYVFDFEKFKDDVSKAVR